MKSLRILSFLVILLLLASAVGAQGDYEMTWWSVDGGAATLSQGGGYSLSGTVGQPDGGELSGGDYTLGGGVWRGGAVVEQTQLFAVYLPLVLR